MLNSFSESDSSIMFKLWERDSLFTSVLQGFWVKQWSSYIVQVSCEFRYLLCMCFSYSRFMFIHWNVFVSHTHELTGSWFTLPTEYEEKIHFYKRVTQVGVTSWVLVVWFSARSGKDKQMSKTIKFYFWPVPLRPLSVWNKIWIFYLQAEKLCRENEDRAGSQTNLYPWWPPWCARQHCGNLPPRDESRWTAP